MKQNLEKRNQLKEQLKDPKDLELKKEEKVRNLPKEEKEAKM